VYLPLRLALLVQMAAVANTAAQQPCAVSPGRMLAVSPGVRIEVREWGGHGEPLLFLAGLTATSRAFDDFAPLFTDQFRVIGITRRGVPPSDTAAADYSATTLTRDLVAVMDSLSIRAAHVAGASFGGDEAIVLAAHYPSRVLTVTLLESYDNSAAAQAFKALSAVDTLDEPFSAYDSTSPLALAANSRRNGNRPWPMSEICAQFRFAPSGRYLGSATSAAVAQALHAGMPRLPYNKVRQPVLAFFRSDRGIEDWVPHRWRGFRLSSAVVRCLPCGTPDACRRPCAVTPRNTARAGAGDCRREPRNISERS
jgi:pimeloyl-ACP methyl ester carboxylesterase